MPPTNPRSSQDWQRLVLRAAIKIHQHLAGPATTLSDRLPYAAWELVRRTMARLQLAQQRGWHRASRLTQLDLGAYLKRLRWEITYVEEQWPVPPAGDFPRNSAGEIAQDLLALHRDFEHVTIDLKQKLITVTTQSVVLSGIDLGPFRIELRWDEIGRGYCYNVVAINPHPARNREDISHPHVSSDLLCEGEGAAAIKAALRSGRLLDFFTLVWQILQHYNAASAHVPLSRWHGETCHDCGYEMDSEEETYCERCEESICSDCSTSCESCSRTLCSSCADSCSQCGRTCCPACLNSSAETDGSFCENCPQPVEESHEPQASAASAEANPVCVGQARVPA